MVRFMQTFYLVQDLECGLCAFECDLCVFECDLCVFECDLCAVGRVSHATSWVSKVSILEFVSLRV